MTVFSEKDAVKNDKGEWELEFTDHSSKQRLVACSNSAAAVVELVNQQIKNDLMREKLQREYQLAVTQLSSMCLAHDGSGARAAAQVLLGAYNNSFHVDLTDLCLLDDENFNHAIAVIKGRVICWQEPHSLLDNGDEVFHKLWERWAHLHANQRYIEHYEF